jgi:transcriptional regulator GlxA family with amidase domain
MSAQVPIQNANTEYTQRIDRVIDYLRANLHRQLKLEELAKVACF